MNDNELIEYALIQLLKQDNVLFKSEQNRVEKILNSIRKE